ncbi:MAG: hypothetical protein RIQ49_2786 [Pseudomonadota bacterium]|jgi:hypothetical protein
MRLVSMMVGELLPLGSVAAKSYTQNVKSVKLRENEAAALGSSWEIPLSN